ncbi:MAG: ankyrin repeat domain-containing protein [Rhodopila sp.]
MVRRGAAAANAPEKREPVPDTLPGAKARAPVAPASKAASDMSPNDAMFDAINRGDIATVKDALSRGAELGARNVLGMTPLELSVDLGRNDISFLLLSMRGEGAPPPRNSGQQMSQKATAAEIKAAQVSSRQRGARVAPKPAAVANKPVSTPRLFANDGGSPVPNAGFLGFDSRSTGTN